MMKKMKSLMRLVGIALALLLLFTASACSHVQAEEADLLIEKEDEKVFEETKEKSLSKMQDLSGLVLQFTDEDTLVLKQNDSVLKVEHLQKDVCAFFSKTSSSVLPNIKQPDFSTLWGGLLGKEISLSSESVSEIRWDRFDYTINATYTNDLTVVFTQDNKLVLFEKGKGYVASTEAIPGISNWWNLFYETQKE